MDSRLLKLSMIYSKYDEPETVARHIANDKHREFIGGMWEKIGSLQLDYLIASGLKPDHKFIDIGCGSFRLGVKLIPYLEAGNYYGIDISEPLMRAGYDREIVPAGLAERFPWSNVAANPDFNISGLGGGFAYGIAQSVFSHMPVQQLEKCLNNIAPGFRPGGRFYATYFRAPEEQAARPFKNTAGITTHPDKDPYHHSAESIRTTAARCIDWRLTIIGPWQHPRGQELLQFERL